MAALPFRNFDSRRVTEEPENLETLRVTPGAREVRMLWRWCISAVDDDLAWVHAEWEAGSFKRRSYLFRGAAGTGKSVALYAIVHTAIQRGWAVLYMPQLGRLLNETDEAAVAHAVLRALRLPAGVDIPVVSDAYASALRDPADASKHLRRLVSHLKVQVVVPFLFAIDQWNVVQNAVGLLADLFRPFDQLKMQVGVCIAAVSSSFQAPPSGLFRDADMQERSYRIPLYLDDEFAAIVDDLRGRQLLPTAAELPLAELQRICGNVPRMLGLVELSWANAKRAKRTGWSATSEFRQHAVTYYVDRVKRTLERGRLQSARQNEQRDLERFAALVYLNKHTDLLSTPSMPSAWDWSGLFNTGTHPPSFACPAVAEAFYTVLSDASTFILDSLATHPNTRGTAFEYFFLRCFQRALPHSVTLEATWLDGSNSSNFTLNVSHIVRQDRSDPAAALRGCRDQTLVVCFDGHACVDFVLYQGDVLYLFQISVQSYGTHKVGIEGMLDSLHELGNKSVCAFYVQHGPVGVCNIEVPTTRVSERLAKRVRYVYVTSDETRHRESTIREGGRRNVLRVNGAALFPLGADYTIFCR